MKTIREINRYDYELYDLLENYFIDKQYPPEIKKLVQELLTIMKKDYIDNAIKSYNKNDNDIIDVKDYEELVFNDGTTYKREIMFDVFMLYSLLYSRKDEFHNMSEQYQDMVWNLFKKVEKYENEKETKLDRDIIDIKYYKETELED